MRVIGGFLKGRRIEPPSKNWPVRPTTDFAREALFNILDNRLDYAHISALDLFGGTGVHSIELASRGCVDITYVDRYTQSIRWMKDLAKAWSLPVTAIQSDVMTFLKNINRQWDYIFADPPYDMKGLELFPSIVFESAALPPGGLFVMEHKLQIRFQDHPGFLEARTYGQTVFSFFTAGS